MLRASTLLAVGLSVSAALLNGCGDARPVERQSSGGGSCASCHGDATRQPTAANPRLPAAPPVGTHGEAAATDRAVGAHQLHLNDGALSPAVACEECHDVPADPAHSNGTVDMTWGALATTGGVTGIVWNGSTCASTYCHGNFRNGNAANAPTWTAPRASACGTCHGSASNPAPGGTHPTVAAGDCGNCHDGYTGTSVNLALHLNGAFDVASLSCTSCHGTSGRPSVANADPNQPAAPPVDTGGSGSTSSPGVGAHLVHANNGGTSRPVLCAACHAGAVPTQPVHSNGTVTVAFGGLATTGGVTPGPYTPGSGGSCSATYCHGNFPGGNGTAASPAWTTAGALGCAACHGSPPPLSATVHHPRNLGCATCHPLDAASHVDGTVQKPTGCTACHGNLSLTGQTLANASVAAPGYDAGSVDSTGQGAASAPGVGAHAAHLKNTNLRSAPIACAECHQLPPSDADVGHATGAGTGGARATLAFGSLARGAVNPWSGSVTPAYAGSSSGAYGSTAGSCASSYCHGNFRNGATGNAPGWTAGATAAACGSCHGTPPGGTHPANNACGTCHGVAYSTTTVDKALHMNGVLDGGGEPTSGGTNCGGCHGTIVNAMTTASPPAGSTRHFLGGGDTPAPGTGTWTSAATLKSSPLYATANCVSMCHGDHPHDASGVATTTHEWNAYLDANVRSATRNATTRDDTDFDPGLASGGLCTSCHQVPVDANHPAVGAVAFGASAHDYVSNTVGTSTYTWSYTLHDGGVFRRNCTKCHADRNDTRPGDTTTPFGAVHSSAYASLLAGTTRAGGASPNAAPPAFVCYNCHGNGTVGVDLSGVDLWTATQKAFYHPVNREAAHDSVLEAAAAWNSGRYSGANRHASCLDCHDPHEAGPTLMNRTATATATRNQIPVGSPLTGATGVTFGPTFPALWSPTQEANFGTNPVTATREYEVCFKCHSSFAFGATAPTPPGQGDSATQQTDVAMELNPNNRSMHPVVSSLNLAAGTLSPKSLPASYLLAPWNVNAGTQTMTCTDCHNTDSASPAAQGPHGSAIRYLLAGTNKAWPYTTAGATSGTLFQMSNSANGFGTNNGLFCRNCHSNPGVSGTSNPNTAHRQFNGQHSGNAIGTCVRCHIRVPHGGKVSRLIVTSPNAPARYTVSGQTLNFTRFVKNSNYTGSAWFGTTCGEHSSGGTGGEAW